MGGELEQNDATKKETKLSIFSSIKFNILEPKNERDTEKFKQAFRLVDPKPVANVHCSMASRQLPYP